MNLIGGKEFECFGSLVAQQVYNVLSFSSAAFLLKCYACQSTSFSFQVLFAEPVVVTACEFLEQNSSSTCSTVKLSGYSCYFVIKFMMHTMFVKCNAYNEVYKSG